MKYHRHKSTKVLVPTQYSLPADKHNMNAYQRIYYGSRYAHLTLLVRRNAEVSEELERLVEVHRASVQNRWCFLTYAVLLAIVLRFQGYRLILTEPSGFAVVGFFARFLAGYHWVLDVWDRPRWRPGQHEQSDSPRFSDRLAFWVMRHADEFVLSVLPRAAKDIRPDPSRCLEFHNGIDSSLVGENPPVRSLERDPTLHLAYGRSRFWETIGLEIVIRATEELMRASIPLVIHIVGELPDAEGEKIRRSPAANLFKIHGFINAAQVLKLYRTIHVGIVPYPPCEDLSYIFPVKVLEHLSQGNPVIASRLPGLCRMIQHDENGLLIEPGSPDALAAAIARLQIDVDLYNRLARNALESVKRFDAEEKNRRIFGALLAA